MSNTIEIIISAVSKGVRETVQKTTKDINSGFKKSRLAVKAFNASIGSGHKAIAGLSRQMKGLIGAYVGFHVFRSAADSVVSFNSTIEQSRIGVAALVRTFMDVTDEQGRLLSGNEAYAQSMQVAVKIQQQLQLEGLKTTATYSQLLRALQEGIGPAFKAGFNPEQVVKFTSQMTQAAAAISLPMDQLGQELRAILDGTIDRNARIAKALGLTNEKIKEMAASGKLFDFLIVRLKEFEVAGSDMAKTFVGASSNLTDAIQMAFGISFQQSFQAATDFLLRLRDAIVTIDEASGTFKFNENIINAFAGLDKKIRDLISRTGDIDQWVSMVAGGFSKIGIAIISALEFISKYHKALLAIAGTYVVASVITKITMAVKGLNTAFMILSGSSILTWLGGLRAALSAAAVSALTLTASLAAVSAALAIPAIIQAANAWWGWKKATDAAGESQDRLNKLLDRGLEKFKSYAHVIMPEDITKSTREELKELNGLLLKSRAYWQHMVLAATDPAMAADATAALEKVKKKLKEVQSLQKGEISPKPSAPVPDKPPVASGDALSKSHLARLNAATKTALAMLTDTYKKGETTLEEYFSRRKALIETQFAEEISLLQKSADAQTDPDKKLALEDQIFSKQQAHTQALLALKQQQMTAEDELVRKKTETADLLADLEKRAEPGTGSGLDAVFTEELAQMDARHAEELSRLQELTASKSEIEDAYRMQKLEKEKLLADQEKRIHDQNLQNAKTIAGGTADVFTNLYELTGKKHKEFFILAKTAAIAEALISTYQGAQQAFTSLSGIPIVGPALGAAAATAAVLAGLARVASIKAQKLAAGGFVAGHSPSPTADNIPIMATAGEFMQPVSAVQHYGHSVMEAIKKRLIPREVFQGFTLPGLPSLNPSFAYAAGGMVNAAPSTSGSQQGTEINIVNIIDPEEIEDYMNSPGGENAIMNVISSKKRTIERILF